MSFENYLKQLEATLRVPYPKRRDLIIEIQSHLEALYEEALARGQTPEQAHSRAITALAADGAFVQAMDDVHRPAVARALASLPQPVATGIEHTVITAIGFLLVATTILQEAPMIEFIASGGFFMIPINLAGAAILFLGLERGYSLLIKKDHSPENLEKRLGSLSFLALICGLTGVVGTLTGLYQAFAMADQIAAKFAGEFPVFEVARIALTTAIWGLTLSLLGVVIRFAVQAKSLQIRHFRAT